MARAYREESMETIKVQWQSHQGVWLVAPINSDFDSEGQLLSAWAEELADLTSVRLILSASNYSTHWLSMPGVSSRNLARALPFALEESLINDIDEYLIVPAGSANKKVRAYAVASDLVERLLQECELHHIQVRELIPETQCLPAQNLIRRQANGWQVSLPGQFEGYVPDMAMTPVLETSLGDFKADELMIWAASLDQAQLLKTNLDTGFDDVFSTINITATTGNDQIAEQLQGKLVNLLVGQFQVREAKEDKPAAWWRSLAGLAAVWLIASAVYLFIDNSALKQKEMEVRTASIKLYKQLFPGERVKSLDRQMREKLAGGNSGESGGFISLINSTSRIYAAKGLQKKLHLQSIRFNDRLQELVIEVKASSLGELQTFKQALEQEGLTAEVASATNDKDGVKGRLKIGGAA